MTVPADMTLQWGKDGEVTMKGTTVGWICDLPGEKRLAVVDVPDGSFVCFAHTMRRGGVSYEHHGASTAQKAVDAVHGMMSAEHARGGLALGEDATRAEWDAADEAIAGTLRVVIELIDRGATDEARKLAMEMANELQGKKGGTDA